jgi:predicted RNA binding protein YcfA (HicA-like mRNA interferase family)
MYISNPGASAPYSRTTSSPQKASAPQFAGKGCTGPEMEKFLAKLGFSVDPANGGSHRQMKIPHNTVTVPDHGGKKPLSPNTFGNIIKSISQAAEDKGITQVTPEDVKEWLRHPKEYKSEMQEFKVQLTDPHAQPDSQRRHSHDGSTQKQPPHPQGKHKRRASW